MSEVDQGEQVGDLLGVQYAGGAVPTIVVSGEIDISTSPQLEKALRRALETRPQQVVLDLSAVRFIDSSGVAVLVRAAARVEVVLRDPSPQVHRIIELTGLTSVFRTA